MKSREITLSVALGMMHCLLGSLAAGAATSLVLVVLVRAVA